MELIKGVMFAALVAMATAQTSGMTSMMTVLSSSSPPPASSSTMMTSSQNPMSSNPASTMAPTNPSTATTTTPFVEPKPSTTTPFVEPPASTSTPFVEPPVTTLPTTTPFVEAPASTTTPFVEPPVTTKLTTTTSTTSTTTTTPTTTTTTPTTTPTTTTPTTPTTTPTTTTPMPTPMPTNGVDCFSKKADIVFLLDASSSEGRDNFKKQLNYVNSLVTALTIGPDDVRVGLVTFSTDAHLQFHLNEYMDKTTLLTALNFVPYQDGTTHTEKGLQYVRENSFTPATGDRADAQNVVVVMTDGQSTDPAMTATEARRLRRNNTIIFTVGIGSSVDQKELESIATSANYTLQVPSFDALTESLQKVLDLTCNAINGVTPPGLNIACEERAFDLAILLDTSASEGITHFKEQINFAADFVNGFTVGPTKVQVGAITFGTDVYRQFFLNQYDDTKTVVEAIKRIPYAGGSTYTQKVLNYVRTTFFSPGYGTRPGVPKVVLIMTDGKSTNPTQTATEANLLKQQGYLVFGIGIGGQLDMTEVNNMATDPATMAFQVNTFNDLANFLPTLKSAFCSKIDEIEPVIPTPDPALEGCNSQPSDLVFVLDSSASEGATNFRKQIYFAGNVTQKLDVGRQKVQVATITFSTTPNKVFFLNQYDNKYDVLDAISRTPYISGATYTDSALKYVRETVLSTANGRRLGATPIVIVLTDGQSSDKPETLIEAQRLRDSGAVVIAIGIGTRVDDSELTAIASDLAHKFEINSFDYLTSIQDQIVKEACEGAGPTPAPHPECGDRPADIVFVMDASSSEGSVNFEKMKAFIADFSSQFEIGQGHVQISCVAFSTYIHVEFYLNETSNRVELLNKISNIPFYGGTTMTAQALETIRLDVLRPEHGARVGAADTVILLTDGRSVVPSETKRQADLLKATGAQLITIGVGTSVDTRELENIASDVQHAFSVINFDALKSIEQELVQTACEACTTTEAADILIIVDSSSDESAVLFQKEMDFISNLVDSFKVGPSNTQFSLMTFATDPSLEFWFNTYGNAPDIKASLQKVIFTQGVTNLDKALKFARDFVYLPFHGVRPNEKQYVLLVTDGKAADPQNAIAEADILKQQGKTIMAVGIGQNADKAELTALASDPSLVFIADNKDALDSIHRDITVKTCKSTFELQSTITTAPAL